MDNEVIIREMLKSMTDSELKALKKRIEIILTGDLKALNVDVSQMDLYEEEKAYLERKAIEGRTDATIAQYSYQITRMINFINKPVTYIKTDDILKYLNHHKIVNKVSDLTLNNERTYINAFFLWLVANGYITTNPCASITPIKFEKKEREPLTQDELNEFRSVCSTLRDKAMIETLYSTGCRVSELTGLKISDVNFETREVHLFGKGRKHRISYLNDRALEALQNYLKDRKGTSEYLFVYERFPYQNLQPCAIEKRFRILSAKTNIKDRVFPHRIRHTTATDALANGMPIEQVQMLLGHEDISTTRIYAKTLQNQLKEAHLKYLN